MENTLARSFFANWQAFWFAIGIGLVYLPQ